MQNGTALQTMGDEFREVRLCDVSSHSAIAGLVQTAFSRQGLFEERNIFPSSEVWVGYCPNSIQKRTLHFDRVDTSTDSNSNPITYEVTLKDLQPIN